MRKLSTYLNYLRLAPFALGYGLTGALVGGTLNRVMIADLGFKASLVGLFFAAPLLDAPIRMWLGYRSDAYPIMGRRREPYIIIGSLIAGAGVMMSAYLAVSGGAGKLGITIGILGTFVIYGFGRNLSHNTFQALLADKFVGDQRPRAMTSYEVATLIGLVIGAGILGHLLGDFDPARLLAVSLGAVATAFLFTVAAVMNQEPRTDSVHKAAEKARETPFSKVIRDMVWADPQVRLFFSLVLLTVVGTMAQDVLLEPYGGLVLGMNVGQTTQLTAFWGVGVMISMLISGAFIIKLLGQVTVLRLGLFSSILVFGGVIAAGAAGSVGLFRGLVLVMGLGTGLAGAGMLTIIINFTSSIRAGLLMGVWGFANLLGRAVGSLVGGTVVDVVQAVTGGNYLIAYATVFCLEMVLLAVALYLSIRLDISASRAQLEERVEPK